MKNPIVIPIQGMRSDAKIKENLSAAKIVLSDSEYDLLNTELNKLIVHGEKTDEQIAQLGELRTKMYGSSGIHNRIKFL